MAEEETPLAERLKQIAEEKEKSVSHQVQTAHQPEHHQEQERTSPSSDLERHHEHVMPLTVQEMSEEEKQRLRQMSQMSMWLDGYDDIFSDFDSRPFSQRMLSDDFLTEAKKEVKDTATGKVDLNFLVPAAKRNIYHESVIKKRLKDHFKKQHEVQHEQSRKYLRQGLVFIFFGFLSMLVATYILLHWPSNQFMTHFLAIVFEPAGWFLFWEGLDIVFFKSKEKKPDLEFYEKMADCNISFMSY